jgi:hypothetical protein
VYVSQLYTSYDSIKEFYYTKTNTLNGSKTCLGKGVVEQQFV